MWNLYRIYWSIQSSNCLNFMKKINSRFFCKRSKCALQCLNQAWLKYQGYSVLFNASIHRLTCKIDLPLLQKWNKKKSTIFFSREIFTWYLGEQIAISYQTFKGALDKYNIIPQTFKGALDKYNIIPPTFFQKSWDIYTIRSIGMGNDCKLSFTF